MKKKQPIRFFTEPVATCDCKLRSRRSNEMCTFAVTADCIFFLFGLQTAKCTSYHQCFEVINISKILFHLFAQCNEQLNASKIIFIHDDLSRKIISQISTLCISASSFPRPLAIAISLSLSLLSLPRSFSISNYFSMLLTCIMWSKVADGNTSSFVPESNAVCLFKRFVKQNCQIALIWRKL